MASFGNRTRETVFGKLNFRPTEWIIFACNEYIQIIAWAMTPFGPGVATCTSMALVETTKNPHTVFFIKLILIYKNDY